MKTVSGLTPRHLRFDVAAFVSQLSKIDQVTGDQSATTHPSMLIRSKALLWYSMSDYFCKGEQVYSPDQMREIDRRIERDLTRYVDGIFKRRIDQTKKDLLLWMLTYESVQSGQFSKKAQSEMITLFGEDTVQRLRSFLGELMRCLRISDGLNTSTRRAETTAGTPVGLRAILCLFLRTKNDPKDDSLASLKTVFDFLEDRFNQLHRLRVGQRTLPVYRLAQVGTLQRFSCHDTTTRATGSGR